MSDEFTELVMTEVNKAVADKDYARLQTIARALEKAAKGTNPKVVAIARTLRSLAAQWLAKEEADIADFDNMIRDCREKARKYGNEAAVAGCLKAMAAHDQYVAATKGSDKDAATAKRLHVVECLKEIQDILQKGNQ